MARRHSVFAVALAPLVVALACSAPFVGVSDEDDATSGAEADTAPGGLGAGGWPGILGRVKAGTTAGAGAFGTEAGAGSEGGRSGESDAGSAGAQLAAGAPGVVGASGECPMLGGEKLVRAGGFCIDQNEVTAAHYQAFLDRKPSLLAQPDVCIANTSFTNGCKATEPEKQPQRCVDWCDARAYCESVGKHLCGSGVSGAAAVPFDAPPRDPHNQWYAACSRGGELAYPYGDVYDGSACWGAERPGTGTLTVKSASACVGGYAELWDMSGGLAEWIDSCSEKNDACHIRGGALNGTAEQLRCDWESATPRGTSSNYIGFRCCADLLE